MSRLVSTHSYCSSAPDDDYRQVDLYVPENASADTPLIVFVHGGAWRSEDKAEHKPLANMLCSQGFTVAMPNYRLSLRPTPDAPPAVQHPTHIEDIAQSIAYLAREPPRIGVYDPSKIFLVGHSAGAHIATMLVLSPAFDVPGIRGVVGADGIYNLRLLLEDYPGYDFVAQAFGSDPAAYDAASPTHQKPNRPVPPVLVVHSLQDELLNLAQAEAMIQHLHAVGARADLDTSVPGNHYEMIHTQELVRSITEFISSCLKQ